MSAVDQLEPFASPPDLAARLKRTFDSAETAAVEAMLVDASAYLRDEVIGAHVFPQRQITFKHKVRDWSPSRTVSITMPVQPVITVDAVTIDGVALTEDDWEFDGAVLEFCFARRRYPPDFRPDWLGRHPMVEVTITAGYATAPADLRMWAIVLASQALNLVEEQGQLGGGGVTSVAIDDYRKTWAAAGGNSGYQLPDRIVDQLRDTYGTTVYVTGGRR